MNLADPELELIDPTPNVHTLFLHFDKTFFWTKLASRAVVRWSKRMYSCAGICSYEGRGGLCDIALSEPLLKLRPRKDLIETLLHEMIHAYLFITGNDRDRDGHGPNFQSHMHRINKAAGLNISIYHDFHDEVRLYQTHWWRCNGPCQHQKPYFGIVRRTANRAPGPKDCWWNDHKRKCDGIFIKIKEPENKNKKNSTKKPMGDITKFVNNKTNTKGTKTCGDSTVVITNTNLIKNKVKSPKSIQPKVFEGKGFTLTPKSVKNDTQSDNIAETVRNAWLNKQNVQTNITTNLSDISNKVREVWANKDLTKPIKRPSTSKDNQPVKIKKIDDYFKTKATEILKDVYGTDFKVYQKDESEILAVENKNTELVACPICKANIDVAGINNHIDECLNTEEIKRLTNEPSTSKESKTEVIDIIKIDSIKTETIDIKIEKPIKTEIIDITNIDAIKKEKAPELAEGQKCPCCNVVTNKTMDEHLDECLAFFDNNTTIPEEGSSDVPTVIIDDDDDEFDETQMFNATGTKVPCPVCLTMFEQDDMNEHLADCLIE